MKLYSFMLAESRVALFLAIVAGIVSGACNTGLLMAINAALTGAPGNRPQVFWAFAAMAGLAPCARITSEILLAQLSQGALCRLRMKLSAQVLALPLRDLEELGPHRLLSILTDDIPNISAFIGIAPLLCINGAVALTSLFYMAWLSRALFAVVLGFLAVGAITYEIPLARAMRRLRLAREEHDNLHRHFQALLAGMKELKIHRGRRDAFLSMVLQGAADRFRRLSVSGLKIYAAASSWGQLLVFIAIGVLVFSPHSFTGGDRVKLTGFTLALLYLAGPVQMIMNSAPQFGRANIALRKVEQLGLTLAARATLEPPHDGATPRPGCGPLELIGVTYSYEEEDGSTFHLGPITLTALPGEVVFLAGGNGSGKTTLAKLLLGLYTPASGEIHMNGTVVTDRTRDEYRQNFAAVFSDFFLFETLLGLDAAPGVDAQARAYLEKLRLSHKVRVQDGVLSTTSLSQGQRKRLALLTAWLEDRPVYFFDEWASDQDPAFKEVFYTEILAGLKARGKTVIVISHDERYYKVGDRIVTLESGRLVSDVPAGHLAEYSEAVR